MKDSTTQRMYLVASSFMRVALPLFDLVIPLCFGVTELKDVVQAGIVRWKVLFELFNRILHYPHCIIRGYLLSRDSHLWKTIY